jgi:hypothetical protein
MKLPKYQGISLWTYYEIWNMRKSEYRHYILESESVGPAFVQLIL